MDHTAILSAAEVLPRDHAAGIARQLEKLDALVADLETLPPGAPGAAEKLHAAHVLAQSLYHEASGHPNGGRPDRWYLSVLGLLNTCAERHGLEQSRRPFEF